MKQFILLKISLCAGAVLLLTSCTGHVDLPASLAKVVVTTLAGGGTAGLPGGPDTGAASFKYPTGVAVDAAGNVYVADAGNNLIRKISPLGVVTTLAGSGTPGSANGMGTAASFLGPYGVALDADANVYVTDNGNNLIRKISPLGVVSTLGMQGSPVGITLDKHGNIYVANQNENTIAEISSLGVASILAGCSCNPGATNGVGAAASFNSPAGLAVDAVGNVYVADGDNNLIREVSTSGVVTTFAGSGAQGSVNGSDSVASFGLPQAVAVDAEGNVYVADSDNNMIRKINPSGVVTTLAGTGQKGSTNGDGDFASFNGPRGVAVDADGNVYVADTGNNLIRKITQKSN